VNENLAWLVTRAGLEFDAHPAMALVPAFEAARDDGVGEGEEGGCITPLLAQALDIEHEFTVKHRLKPVARDIAVTTAVDGIAHDHVVGGNAFGHGARSRADPEEPPDHFLTGSDLREGSIPSGIQIDFQSLVVGVQILFVHSGPSSKNRATFGTGRRPLAVPVIRWKKSLLDRRQIRCHVPSVSWKIFPFLWLALAGGVGAGQAKPAALREGDIVFSGSDAGQGAAIMAATRSPYTHCGILWVRDGKWMVLEAVQPVGIVSLEVFKARAKPGTFKVSRLKNPLPPSDVQLARIWAEAQVGKDYDFKFLWDDANLYCSELVWKIYKRAGVELCVPRRFRDYHLEDPKVRLVIEERYGSLEKMPRNEEVVAPSDLAESKLLVDVTAE